MKQLLFIIITLAALFLMGGSCNRKGSGNNGDDQPPMENKYNTPSDAFEQARKNLPQLLNENQRKSFGLASDDAIKNLVKTSEVPITYLGLNQLRDSTVKQSDDGMLYGLGDKAGSRICISVRKQNNSWVQSTIGIKKYVNVINQRPGLTRIVDVPGLEMSFAEVKSADATTYYPVMDYPDANLFQQQALTVPELLRTLENYRATMEKKYGADFTNGNLER